MPDLSPAGRCAVGRRGPVCGRTTDARPAELGCPHAGTGRATSVPPGFTLPCARRASPGCIPTSGPIAATSPRRASQRAGGLRKERKFWHVSRELGNGLRQTVVFLVPCCTRFRHDAQPETWQAGKAERRCWRWYRHGGMCWDADSSRSRETNWECVKWDVHQHSGVVCMVLCLLDEVLQSLWDPSP